MRATLLTGLGSACHHPQEPQVTCTRARPSQPARRTAGSELHEAKNDPIRLHPAEAPIDALTVQPRDGRGRACASEWWPPLAFPNLLRLVARSWCDWDPT